MTISATTGPWPYNGDGATTQFTYDNKIFSNTDLKVYVDGTLQTISTHYTVSGVGEELGGLVTFVTAPPSGTSNVLIVRDVPDTQATEFPVAGPFPSRSVEDALDKATILSQQLVTEQARKLGLAASDPDASIGALPDASSRASKALQFDSAGVPVAIVPTDASGTNVTATGSTTARSLAERFAAVFNVKDYGAKAQSGIDDATAIKAALSAADGTGDIVYFPFGMYRCSESLDLPENIHLLGDGSPRFASYPQSAGNKALMRPGYKDQISGSSILFTAVDKTYTTNRSDRYASMTYAMSHQFGSHLTITGLGIIQDMDVLDSGGSLTTSANDNLVSIDAGLILQGTLTRLEDVMIFGYFGDAGLVVHNQDGAPTINPDYITLTDCLITGGTAIIGHDTAAGAASEGLTGFKGIGTGFYGSDHHTRADGDYTIPVLYMDGFVAGSEAGIRGHTFVGCQFRGGANDAMVFDHSNDVSIMGGVTEFPIKAGIGGADAAGGFVGTANTKKIVIVGLAANADLKMASFIAAITGPYQIIGSGLSDNAIFGTNGRGVRIIGATANSTIQFTDDFTSLTSGWLLFRNDAAADTLTFRYDNATVFSINTNGALASAFGFRVESKTIASDEITITFGGYFAIDTESGGGTDDLSTINGGSYDGQTIILRAASNLRTVVCKDGGGNLRLAGSDFSLDHMQDRLSLMYDGTNWCELSRSDNTT
jgi:hypothetical protein